MWPHPGVYTHPDTPASTSLRQHLSLPHSRHMFTQRINHLARQHLWPPWPPSDFKMVPVGPPPTAATCDVTGRRLGSASRLWPGRLHTAAQSLSDRLSLADTGPNFWWHAPVQEASSADKQAHCCSSSTWLAQAPRHLTHTSAVLQCVWLRCSV